ncbi:L-ascorbate metabolism protein UlaG (beta-lactamase superfamily) [Roseimicrobium gellanilyticum]|uniref:L-ascorbate metabolism protein UlaG (Beta-lactamase superfamily) n=1 Tax=Roseimicrobium gellanilyticum TaxID=748857 RepID=A0A366HVE0_9BACT|nr:MBL fold metallo-hydrolase [Roseimicrobium gellanilyticum]RBP48236.1 L-ascorbate metabolism protein UlaG (beta-lactamase superfamily) [Roseimicrobium gellanilyticum]
MRTLLLAACFGFLTNCAGPGIGKYKDAVVADVPVSPESGVRVTYLGVNGYLLQSSDATVLVDPFFSRPPLRNYLVGEVKPNKDRIDWGMRSFPATVDLILVTHGHIDHLLDVPIIAQRTGAKIVASHTSCNLVKSLNQVPEWQLAPMLKMKPGGKLDLSLQETKNFENVTVQALYTEHDRLCGIELNPGTEDNPPATPPKSAHDWVAGEPLAFIITMGGKRIFISAGMVHAPRQKNLAPVDLAITGVALNDPRSCLAETVRILKPKYVLPSHQDNFFIPAERGFRFSVQSDFEEVKRELPPPTWELGKNLILLDYFRPWTLY